MQAHRIGRLSLLRFEPGGDALQAQQVEGVPMRPASAEEAPPLVKVKGMVVRPDGERSGAGQGGRMNAPQSSPAAEGVGRALIGGGGVAKYSYG